MGKFCKVLCCLAGLAILSQVTPMEISTIELNRQTTTETTSSNSRTTLENFRPIREDGKTNDDVKHQSTTQKGDDDDEDKRGGEKGATRALRLLRQHRTTTEKDILTTTKKSEDQHSSSSTRTERQVPEAPVEPQGPEVPEPSAAQPVPSAHVRPPAPAPAPQPAPSPSRGGSSGLTLPDGAEIIIGPIVEGFSCQSRNYGYYADTLNACKIFHVCVPVSDENGVTNPIQWSFFCGNQTLFNQELLVCDHAVNVDCSKSENFYSVNDNFGRPEDKVGAPVGQHP